MECNQLKKPKQMLKTIKIRLILNQTEKDELNKLFGVFRWCYNVALDIYKLEKDKKTYTHLVKFRFQNYEILLKNMN